MKTEQEQIADITKRNGAYLISFDFLTEIAENEPSVELYNCASSKVVAKRVARKMAEELGFTGPYRWENDENGGLIMMGFVIEDEY